jgi:hypothetical protein
MNRKFAFYMLGTLWLLLAGQVIAQGGGLRERADRSIRQTSIVLAIGRQAVKKNKVYTGSLAKAHNHREYAIWLFRQGNYVRAIHHSRRSRNLAAEAIRANQQQVQAELLADEGTALPGPVPSDTELDEDLQFNFNATIRSDEQACQMADAGGGF